MQELLRCFRAGNGSKEKILGTFTDNQLQEEFWAGFISLMEPIESSIVAQVQRCTEKIESANWQKLEKVVRQKTNEYLQSYIGKQEGLAFLVCFDEAGEIGERRSKRCAFDLLTLVHRASRLMGDDLGGLLLMMDTLCAIPGIGVKPNLANENTAPTIQDRVFVNMMTQDIWGWEPRTIEESIKISSLANYGRPLWGSALKSDATLGAELLDFAERKLVGGTDPYYGGGEFDQRCAIALFASRVSIRVMPHTTVSEKLVRSHMAHLDAIDRDGSSHCSYISDPILSLAAGKILADRKVYLKVIKSVTSLIKYGHVEAGFRGELLTQLLTLWAVDQALFSKGIYQDSLVTVSGFLERLFGTEAYKKASLLGLINPDHQELLDAFIHLNHYVQIYDYTPTRADLAFFLSRGAGIVCKAGQEGFDLVIPVLLKKPVREGNPQRTKTRVSFNSENIQYRKRVLDVERIEPTNPAVDAGVRQAASLLARPEGETSSFVKPPEPPLHSTCGEVLLPSSEVLKDSNSGHSIDADSCSYILVQCKNRPSLPSRFTREVAEMLPLEELQNLGEVGATARPYMVLGVFYTQLKGIEVADLKHPPVPGNCLKLSLLNPHYAIRDTSVEADAISEAMGELLRQFPNPADLEKGEEIWKAAAHVGAYGTETDAEKFSSAHEALDRVHVNPSTVHASIASSSRNRAAPSAPRKSARLAEKH